MTDSVGVARARGEAARARRWRGALLASAVLWAGCGAVAAEQAVPSVQVAQASQVHSFSIAPQPLASALARFGEQSGLQVSYASSLADGVTSPGVSGSLTAEQALARLLAGTGIAYSFTGPQSVTLLGGGSSSGSSMAIGVVTVTGASGGNPADLPFETAGSGVHISREELDRIPPTTMGDIFKSTSGVISSGNRTGSGLNVNIRGLQGMNRVATLIDGTQQGTSNYIGYRGNTASVYLDPDFIGGIDITKGPSDGAYGAGSMGGVVYMRTLEARDIVQPGETVGFRLKGSLGSGTAEPKIGSGDARDEAEGFPNGSNYAVNIAGAVMTERYEFILALARRKQGNYFAGENGDDEPKGAQPSPFGRGSEVFNTSEDVRSLLTKGKVYLGDSHSLEVGYIYYENEHGQLDDYQVTLPNWVPKLQYELTRTTTHTLTGRYVYNPAYSELINLRLSAWMSNLTDDLYSTGYDRRTIRTYGGELQNASLVDTPLGTLTLNLGASYAQEDAKGPEAYQYFGGIAYLIQAGPNGTRTTGGLFSQASLEITPWLTLAGGLRYDYYDLKPEGVVGESYEGSHGTRFNPSASITVTPFEGIQLYALYAEGWRPPSLRESAFILGTTLVPNPDLDPEVSRNYEVGLNVLRHDLLRDGDTLRFKAAYFDNTYEDYITRYSPTGFSPTPGATSTRRSSAAWSSAAATTWGSSSPRAR